MDKQRIKEIDIMRGIAIILVILGHAIIVYPINLHEIPWCNALFTWLSSVHMPLFFLLAGFCYSFRRVSDKNWGVSYGSYLFKKVKRIAIPYIVFCVLEMAVRVMFSQSVNNKRGIIESLENMILRGGVLVSLHAVHRICDISDYRKSHWKEETSMDFIHHVVVGA